MSRPVSSRPQPAIWITLGAVALVAGWEAAVRAFGIRPFVLLRPSQSVTTFADTPGFFLRNAWTTAWHLGLGLAIALAVAGAVGAVLASIRRLEYVLQPLLVMVMVTPWVAYISSVRLQFGSGTPSVVFLTALVAAPPFVYATVGGLRSADAAAIEVFRSVDARPWEVLWRLRLPSALPALFTAGRFNVGLGLAATYFAEGAAGARSGLGEAGRRAAAQNLGALLWTTILCTAVLGLSAQLALTVVERWALRWHVSQRTR